MRSRSNIQEVRASTSLRQGHNSTPKRGQWRDPRVRPGGRRGAQPLWLTATHLLAHLHSTRPATGPPPFPCFLLQLLGQAVFSFWTFWLLQDPQAPSQREQEGTGSSPPSGTPAHACSPRMVCLSPTLHAPCSLPVLHMCPGCLGSPSCAVLTSPTPRRPRTCPPPQRTWPGLRWPLCLQVQGPRSTWLLTC